jgi:hypothetical protein
MDFDQIYNETYQLDNIYTDKVKEYVSNLFQGGNSCVLLFGPNDSGKSYCLKGGDKEPEGLIGRTARDLFNLIELGQQVNSGYRIKNLFGLKMSIYQIYNDNIYDLLSKNNLSSLQISKLREKDTGSILTKINDLTELEVKSLSEYNSVMNDATQNRKFLEKSLKINEMDKKSNTIYSFVLVKKEVSSEQVNNYTFETKYINFSQLDFVELTSSNYGLDVSNFVDKNDILYKNTNKNFKALTDNITSSSLKRNSNLDTNLTLALKKTINVDSSILFINCVHSDEEPPIGSFSSLKVF